MKWKIGFYLTVLWALLSGCGGGSGTPVNEQNSPTAKEYSESELIDWKEACIDDNEPVARSHRDMCNDIYEDAERCERDYQANLELIEAAWKTVKRRALVDLQVCMADFRVSEEFCYAKYEESLSFNVDLECRSAAQWN